MKPIAVYKRVSTDKQETTSQSHAVDEWLQIHKPGCPVVEFTDEGYTGKNNDRPAFQAMCEAIRAGDFSAVVVFRLDRVGRDALLTVREVADWLSRGMEFFAVDQPHLHLGKDNPMRMSMLGIFSDQTQMEREAIVSRIKSGLAAAKAKGQKLGRAYEIDMNAVAVLRAQGLTMRQVARELGISVSSVSRTMKRRKCDESGRHD